MSVEKHNYIEVYDRKTRAIIHRLDCTGKDWRSMDRVERGMRINMHDKYTTRQVFSVEARPCGDVDEPDAGRRSRREAAKAGA